MTIFQIYSYVLEPESRLYQNTKSPTSAATTITAGRACKYCIHYLLIVVDLVPE